jgi:hypothetical protein
MHSNEPPPIAQPRRMNPKVVCLRKRHAAFLDQSSSLKNSRVNFRLSMTHLLLHKTLNSVSSKPASPWMNEPDQLPAFDRFEPNVIRSRFLFVVLSSGSVLPQSGRSPQFLSAF